MKEVGVDQPVLVDRYIMGRAGEWTPSATAGTSSSPVSPERIRARYHSGDSIGVYPTFGVSRRPGQDHRLRTVKLGARWSASSACTTSSSSWPATTTRLCHRGQSALVAHRTVPLQVDGHCRWPHIATQVISENRCASEHRGSAARRRRAGTSRPGLLVRQIRGMDSRRRWEIGGRGNRF